jgi:hypothetical protein
MGQLGSKFGEQTLETSVYLSIGIPPIHGQLGFGVKKSGAHPRVQRDGDAGLWKNRQ